MRDSKRAGGIQDAERSGAGLSPATGQRVLNEDEPDRAKSEFRTGAESLSTNKSHRPPKRQLWGF
ncbi:hypothetical protein A3I18_00625 [Candidatus Campbellbacteria bacterium RIFCSPLOWO2_02_FULL_35_11]|uniref:Uncharacterized protein n=1 Tax=Candidatus Campbellbacteria bacterium RIFCSPLOWO2_02_FULL_35_11 TaxID=1797581 RepID=A0A1F5ETZ4_9BACT|nr:MAG: hypothetical protein A3I18_00625 [Candidatus Campbellbacteria bacterium RIFCSPLOWO2_02_FULL_35_11]